MDEVGPNVPVGCTGAPKTARMSEKKGGKYKKIYWSLDFPDVRLLE